MASNPHCSTAMRADFVKSLMRFLMSAYYEKVGKEVCAARGVSDVGESEKRTFMKTDTST